MNADEGLEVGDIVQINPMEGTGGRDWFGACLMVVSQVNAWGAQGYVKNAGVAGEAYYRVKWENMAKTGGKVVWDLEPYD